MLFKERIDAWSFGALLATEFVPWIQRGATLVRNEQGEWTDYQLHVFATRWLIECAGFIGASIANVEIRAQIVSSYIGEIGGPAQKGGYVFSVEEVFGIARSRAPMYANSETYPETCRESCRSILRDAYKNGIAEERVRMLAETIVIDFSACHRLILFLLQRSHIVKSRMPRAVRL